MPLSPGFSSLLIYHIEGAVRKDEIAPNDDRHGIPVDTSPVSPSLDRSGHSKAVSRLNGFSTLLQEAQWPSAVRIRRYFGEILSANSYQQNKYYIHKLCLLEASPP